MVLACGGCQVAFHVLHIDEPASDAAIDMAPDDGSGSGSGSGSACTTFGPWAPPIRVSSNDATLDDDNPALSPDGQMIVFERWPSGGGPPDLYYATRQGDDFINPRAMSSNDSASADSGPFWRPDGHALYFTQGNSKMQVAVASGLFGSYGVTHEFDSITTYFERPRFSSDGLEVVFYDGNPADIWHAIRPTTASTIWTASALPSLDSPEVDDGPSLSGDDLTIYYASRHTGTGNPRHLFEAHRTAKQGQFDVPVDLGNFGVADPFGPDISRDGKTLVFTGYPGSTADTYLTTRSCQ